MNLQVSVIDLIIVVVYVAGCVALGLWVGRGQRNLADYSVGSRDLPWWALLVSIVATETSTVTFLSVPGLAFFDDGDMTFLQLPLGYVIGRYAAVFLLLPLYFRGELFTSYQVLDQRFGGAVKRTASMLFLVTRTLADGLRLFLAALALSAATKIDINVAIVAVGVATVVYTVFGGMKAVVWTDFIQFGIYLLGAVIALFIVVGAIGGWGELWRYGVAHQKFQVVSFGPADADSSLAGIYAVLSQPYTLWAGLFGGIFVTLGTHGTDQLMVQRLLSARNQKDAARALSLSGWVVLAQFALFLLLGVALAAFYFAHPPAEPFDSAHPDKVFASFIVTKLPVGVVGLTLAAVFSAAMSTLSSSLNSSATTAMTDFLLTSKKTIAPQTTVARTRWLTVVFGVLQMAAALIGQRLTSSVVASALSIQSFTTGIVLGVFFLATFGRPVSREAALIAMIVGLAGMSAIAFHTSIAWPWYSVVGSIGTFLIGKLVNLIVGSVSTP